MPTIPPTDEKSSSGQPRGLISRIDCPPGQALSVSDDAKGNTNRADPHSIKTKPEAVQNYAEQLEIDRMIGEGCPNCRDR